jgi:hypothetical protein
MGRTRAVQRPYKGRTKAALGNGGWAVRAGKFTADSA